MNNRYICKAKRKDNNEWVTGYYVCLNENCHRIYIGYAEKGCGDYYPEYCEVIPKTVGQCTGLKDKNRKLIFVGDIVKINSRVASSETRETAETEIGFVEYDIDECEYRITHVNGTIPEYGKNYSLNLWRFKRDTNEVIGNIHDNPELLEVKE